MLLSLMALMALLPLTEALDIGRRSTSIADPGAPVVCSGTQESEQTSEDSVQKLRNLRNRLQGCQFVIGDIHLVRIDERKFDGLEDAFDFSFLSTIKEVTGCVKLVDSCFSRPLEFNGLEVIRGTACGNASLLLQFNPDCPLKMPYIAFPSLRLIGGGVSLFEVTSCYIERHISFPELFGFPPAPVVLRKGNCRELDNTCHSNCTEWPEDGQRHCWGPELRHCQPRTRCRSLSIHDCPYQRCFVDSQSSERCCSDQCLGGCHGSLPNQCLGCRNFNRNGSCVHNCELDHYYDPGAAQYIRSSEAPMLPHGPVCVTECPESFFKEDGSCVKKCMTGRSPNADGMCVKINESRICAIDVNAASVICTAGNPLLQGLTNESLLCTEFHGSITIYSSCFEPSSQVPNQIVLSMEQLYTMFSRLRVVRGEIQMHLESQKLRNLTFLSKLERLDSRPEEKNSGRLVVVSKTIEFFGLVSLRYIYKRVGFFLSPSPATTTVSLCTGFLPKQAAFNESIIESGNIEVKSNWIFGLDKVNNGVYKSNCPYRPDSCDPLCDRRYGCWGPGPTNCVLCRSVKAGPTCIEACNSKPGWFFDAAQWEKINNSKAERVCSPCHQSCSKCNGPGRTNCTACPNGTFLDGSVCVAECNRERQFADTTDRLCRPCPKICTQLGNGRPTCTGNKTSIGPGGCQFCQHVMVTPASEEDPTPTLKCLLPSDCSAKHYVSLLHPENDQLNNFTDFMALKQTVHHSVTTCMRCAPHCLTCKDTDTKCTSCQHYSVESEITGDIRCETRSEPRCSDGYFPDHGNQTCRPCRPSCSTCSGPGDSDCLSCIASKYAVPNELSVVAVSNDSATMSCEDACPKERPHPIASKRGLVCIRSTGLPLISALMGAGGFIVVLMGLLLVVCCILRRRRSDKSDDEEKEELEPILNRAYLATISENELAKGHEVGSGAFGTVYKGEWTPADGDGRKTTVAIKILADSGDNSLSSELLEESRIMASVDHPHCVRLVGICMTQPLQLVTQFMPLGNLRDFLRDRREPGQVSGGQMLRYAAQIASGMAHLERCNIIHRDLACRNVLVSSSRCVRITDFGLAKALDNASQEYQASGGKLPVKWLALESLVSRRFTHKSDVWSYGVTLWEIFTFGEPPYANVRPQDLADYLEKGERLPQPAVCMLDVYMLMIKCWMLDEHHRPTFDELETNFTRMCGQPERFVFNRGVRHASHCSSSNSRGGSGGGVGSVGPKSPRHSNNNRQSFDELDNAYVAMDDGAAGEASDLDNDVFVDHSTLTASTTCRRPQLSSQPLLSPPSRQQQQQQKYQQQPLCASAPPPPPPPPPLMKPQQRSFSVTASGRRRAVGPPPPLSSNLQNQYTLGPCQPGPSSSDYYLQPVCRSPGSRQENTLPLPPRRSPSALVSTPSSPPPLPPPLLRFAGSPAAVANPEYFFHYSVCAAVGSAAAATADTTTAGAVASNPASSNDSGIASPKFEFGRN